MGAGGEVEDFGAAGGGGLNEVHGVGQWQLRSTSAYAFQAVRLAFKRGFEHRPQTGDDGSSICSSVKAFCRGYMAKLYSVHVRTRKLRIPGTPLMSGSTREPIFGSSRGRSIAFEQTARYQPPWLKAVPFLGPVCR